MMQNYKERQMNCFCTKLLPENPFFFFFFLKILFKIIYSNFVHFLCCLHLFIFLSLCHLLSLCSLSLSFSFSLHHIHFLYLCHFLFLSLCITITSSLALSFYLTPVLPQKNNSNLNSSAFFFFVKFFIKSVS